MTLTRNAAPTAAISLVILAATIAASSLAQQSARFWVKRDADVKHDEIAPHDGKGVTTAYRYFDDVKDATVIFRKRSMPKGSYIGKHVLTHDEVYYVESGEGELVVDGVKRKLVANTAAYMKNGADVSIHQLGDANLVIIVAYPPA